MHFLQRAAAALCLLIALAGADGADGETFKRTLISIDAASGPQPFLVELALSPAQQEQGLMWRREMAPNAGMLFVFQAPEVAHFWMHNTILPLDMLFIAADGRVAGIHAQAKPQNDDIIASDKPVLAVLELNAGAAARFGIKPGDIVHYAAFETDAKH
jgi:uncharacterized protein